MSTFPEEVQENVTPYQQGKDIWIVGKQWAKFDSHSRKQKYYERSVFDKSPNGTFLTGLFLIMRSI